jgi:hypothetical protein
MTAMLLYSIVDRLLTQISTDFGLSMLSRSTIFKILVSDIDLALAERARLIYRYPEVKMITGFGCLSSQDVAVPSNALKTMYHVRVAPPSSQPQSKVGCVKKLNAACGLIIARLA